MSVSGTQDITWEIEAGVPLTAINGTQDLQWPINAFIPSVGGFQAIAWRVGTSDETVTVVIDAAPTGLVGDLTVSIITFDGAITVTVPTTEDIQEIPPGTGRYVATVPLPDIGDYFVVWNIGATTTFARLTVFLDNHWEVTQLPGRWAAAA